MGKKTKVIEKVQVGIGKVSAALSSAFSSQAATGDFIVTVCKICAIVFDGKPANSISIIKVADDVCRLQGWSKASEGPRKSECRKIVRNYATFEDAAVAYRKTHTNFSWGTAMRLLTCLNKEPVQKHALKLMDKKESAVAEVKPIKIATAAVKKIMAIKSRAAKIVALQEGIEELCTELEIEW